MTEMNWICLVLFDLNSRIFGPCLAAIDRIAILVLQIWWDQGAECATGEAVQDFAFQYALRCMMANGFPPVSNSASKDNGKKLPPVSNSVPNDNVHHSFCRLNEDD
jgi:hypothetical protein